MNESEQPLVSVIMSAYNEEPDWLIEAIESIINQTYRNIEFIIILDNPNSNILEKIIKDYCLSDNRIRFYKNDTNIGLVKSLNRALGYVNGEFVARMDADDVSLPERLEKQVKYMELHPDIDLLGCRVIYIDEAGSELFTSPKIPEDTRLIKSCLKNINCFCHSTWLFRRVCADKIGGYRNVLYAEDYDFLCRLVTNNLKLANTNEILLKYRNRESGISNRNEIHQFINSKRVIKLYKQRLKYGVEKETIDCFGSIDLSEKEQRKYIKVRSYFAKSKDNTNQNKILMVLILFKGFIISKNLRFFVINYSLVRVKMTLYTKFKDL